MTQNEAYDDLLVRCMDATSIFTTGNEAYTSVSMH